MTGHLFFGLFLCFFLAFFLCIFGIILFILGLFGQSKKWSNFFPGGLRPPQNPTSSRLLSQPPQAKFERLSQVGRCRGLQRWEVLGQ